MPDVIEYENPNWFNFIISDDLYNNNLDASWAVIESYKSDFSEFIFKTSNENICVLTKDENWPNIDWEDNLLGFHIS